MADKATITIEFDHDGNANLDTSDLRGFPYIVIIQCMATACRAFIDQTATDPRKQGAASQKFLEFFLDDVDVTDSTVTRP